ncbi:MAG: YceD family protein [Methylococcales bacterium]|nr:YceD family protein [Methylococcales bacterium]
MSCEFDPIISNLYNCIVMSDKLPDLIDPLLLAERHSVLSGAIKITALERLSDLVAECDGFVEIEVAFTKEGKQPVASGTIKTELMLECQSCLQPLPWPLDIGFKLGVVASMAEADRLKIDCEPLLFNGEKISLNALIEDEILLALPDYPKHGYDCIGHSSSGSGNFETKTNHAKAENPFSVLAKLKKTGD